MEKITHKTVAVNGINMHIAELGEGPLVLFLHGFPELWYSWRHQILFLAARGYRAVAPDLRGFGDTTGAPTDDPSNFTALRVVGDLVALLQSISPDEDKVFVVGHDWGALMAWYLCMFRPEKVKALVNLSVHFFPRNPHMSPVDGFRFLYGDDHYICRFQEPGEIEAELAPLGVKTCLKNFLTFRKPEPFYFPKGKGFSANTETDGSTALPSWLPEEDLDYFVSRFEKTGFTGGVNYYRAANLLPFQSSLATPCVDELRTAHVCNLFDEHGKWDIDLLRDIFVEQDVSRIMNTPISLEYPDSWAWKGDNKGQYSVKHGYHMQTREHLSQEVGLEFTKWDHIWKMKERLKLLHICYVNVRWLDNYGRVGTYFRIPHSHNLWSLFCFYLMEWQNTNTAIPSVHNVPSVPVHA